MDLSSCNLIFVPQVFGIKTLVKSYLPVKDAHLRPGIDDLLVLLGNILSFGEISEDIESRYHRLHWEVSFFSLLIFCVAI